MQKVTSQKQHKDLSVERLDCWRYREFREVKGEEYVYVTKHEAGKAKEVLAGVPYCFIDSLSKSAGTGLTNTFEYTAQFTLDSSLGDEALDLDFLISSQCACGHRFPWPWSEITNADSYEEAPSYRLWLIAKNVKIRIREQIKAIEAEQGVQVQIEEGLLNVLNLVEYPTAFGKFWR